MMQLRIDYELAELESAIIRIRDIDPAERDLLLALVRVYWKARLSGHGYHDNGDGRVLLEPSKQVLADALGVAVPTIKRRLTALRKLMEAGNNRFVAFTGDRDGKWTWRTHCYEINFQAIFSADLLAFDPGSGGSRRGITGGIRGITEGDHLRQGDHLPKSPERLRFQGPGESGRGITRGDQGDHNLHHTKEPYQRDHKGPSNQKTIGTNGDDGVSKKHKFIDLRKAEFRDPAAMQRRFEEALEAGLVNAGGMDRVTFFAFMFHLGRQKDLRNPAGVFVNMLNGGKDPFGRTWRTRPAACDDDQARRAIAKLDRERDELAEAHPAEEPFSETADAEPPAGPVSLDEAARERLRRRYLAAAASESDEQMRQLYLKSAADFATCHTGKAPT